MRQILAEMVAALDGHRPGVYCCLVETRGSTPQKAGAAMVVYADGSQSGTLGGGCVEAEVKQRVLSLLEQETPELLTFHLDDNYGWDDGLICGGRMTILAQPLWGGQAGRYFRRYYELAASGTGCIEAVVTTPAPGAAVGARFLFDASGAVQERLHVGDVPDAVRTALPSLHDRPRPFDRGGVAFLPLLPRIRVLIVGAGHVGQAVARLAAEVDFDVWVLDDREMYASRERFPQAERLLVGDIATLLKQLRESEITPSTYALIVTRGHAHDEEALYYLAETKAAYVGLIGSKRKIRLIFEDLQARGVSRAALARVHAPLGVHIGSQTVPEIAVSIVAELIAYRNLGSVPAGARSGPLI